MIVSVFSLQYKEKVIFPLSWTSVELHKFSLRKGDIVTNTDNNNEPKIE